MTTALATRLSDEADQCRNDGADDIARLLDEAAGALRQPGPSGWSVFNTGAEVVGGLSLADAIDYLTPSRLERGWSAVCVINKDNPPSAALEAQPAERGEVVVTTNPSGQCVAVTRQDEEGRILSVIWEAPAPKPAEQAEPVAWAWALTKQLEKREATTRGYLRFSNPQNSSWEPLFRKAPAPARQPLTDERIGAMRQAGYLDADDYPDAWAYERGVRDAERAHGITAAPAEGGAA